MSTLYEEKYLTFHEQNTMQKIAINSKKTSSLFIVFYDHIRTLQ